MTSPVVSALYVYPVKSFLGQQVDTAVIGDRGFLHDRLWMVVDESGVFLTQRTHPQMCRVAASIQDATLVLQIRDASRMELPTAGLAGNTCEVTVWRHRAQAVDQGEDVSKWLTEALGMSCRLVRMAENHVRRANDARGEVGFADAYPFLVISEASLADLNGRLTRALPMNRFRPNIVVAGVDAFAEDHWERVRLGEVTLLGAELCERCAVTTTDQVTGIRSVEPLRTLATYRRYVEGGVVFGRKFVHAEAGVTMRIGDAVQPL